MGEGARPDVKMIRGEAGNSPFGRVAHQVRDAARNRRCRVEPGDRPACICTEALEQKRIVRAGEHDRVGAPAVSVDEAARYFAGNCGVGDRGAREFGFGAGSEPCRADQVHVAPGTEFADKCMGIFAPDGCLRAEHGNALRR